MKTLAMGFIAAAALSTGSSQAGDDPLLTCDRCLDVDDVISPDTEWQVVEGSTSGQPNREYTYEFCGVGGSTYVFSTCNEGTPGWGSYDTALSIWSLGDGTCDTSLRCNDDACSGGGVLLSTITWPAPDDGAYLIVVDGYSSSSGSYGLAYRGEPCASTPTREASWSSVKSIYR